MNDHWRLLRQLLALVVTAPNEQERAQVALLAEQVQEVPRETVEVALLIKAEPFPQTTAEECFWSAL